MITIDVDFNAQNEDGSVRLTTVGAERSLDNQTIVADQIVLLSDGEVSVEATIEFRGFQPVAVPDWTTKRDVD